VKPRRCAGERERSVASAVQRSRDSGMQSAHSRDREPAHPPPPPSKRTPPSPSIFGGHRCHGNFPTEGETRDRVSRNPNSRRDDKAREPGEQQSGDLSIASRTGANAGID